ncbi:MAG: DUF932 domain-containing protein [Pseudomonadota bacterium]|nr:DUF932 domain-containing protein [Pseudomonadota bacterium]
MHNLTFRPDGKVEFAYAGLPAWHKLGSELKSGASIEEWKTAAGLDWEIFESGITYHSIDGEHNFPDKRVLFRSDSKAPLSVVGSDYNIVQPGQVLEFFRDLTSLHGYELSAAGSLMGGKRFWATAQVGKSVKINGVDEVNGQLLLVSSADSTMSTQARFTSTRVVCQNTMTIALSDNSKNFVKRTHRSEWDANETKLDLGILDESWEKFSNGIKRLSEIEVTDQFVTDYFKSKFYAKNVEEKDQTWGAIKKVDQLMGLYRHGTGAELTKGTAWGLVNATTELFTHGSSKGRDANKQFWDSSFGKADETKSDVFSDMMEMFA